MSASLPFFHHTLRGSFFALAVVLGALFIVACGYNDDDPDLNAAKASYVEERGEEWAGACADTDPEQHIGMWCSEVVQEEAQTAVVDFGPTFSHFDVRVRFEVVNGEWEVVSAEPIPPPGADDPTLPPCLVGDGFVEVGRIDAFDRNEADARQVLEFRFARHKGCERVVIDLANEDGEAAERTGPASAEFLRELGVVRVHLESDIGLDSLVGSETEAGFEGEWARRAFLVRPLDGNAFIDIHLGEPALVRVLMLDEPARIVIDLRPGGDALPPPAAIDEDFIVVLSPRVANGERAGVSYPFTIRGYGRAFEANVIYRIRVNGEVVAEDFTTAASWAETWGEFELEVDEDVIGGRVDLAAGRLRGRSEAGAAGGVGGSTNPRISDASLTTNVQYPFLLATRYGERPPRLLRGRRLRCSETGVGFRGWRSGAR